MNWTLLQNSLLVAGLTTLLSVSVGFVAALWLAGLERAWQNRVLLLGIIALSLPSFLVTNCWLHFLGMTGVWRNWLPLNIYSLGGTVWILTLLTWPISLVAALSAWRAIERAQLESDPALGGRGLIRWLLWPMARASLGQAAVLTFVLALNNFAVPAILQVKVFPAEMWVKFSTNFDYAAALILSLPLILAAGILVLFLRRGELSWPSEEGPAAARALRRQLGSFWFLLSGVVTIIVLALSVGLPLAQLASTERTWSELPHAMHAASTALGNTFFFAACTASLCLALSLMSWRWPIGIILWLPFLIPGVLLGIALIFLFNRSMFEAVYQSGAIVIVAWTMRYCALAWHGASHALHSVDRDLTDAARLSGASGWSLFWQVHWPQIAPRLAAAWYVTYLLCLWDVETLVLIVPPGGETLALRIFNLLHYGHNAQVNALCVLLLAVAIGPLLLWIMGCRLRTFWSGATLALTAAFLVGCAENSSNDALLHSQFFSGVQIIGKRGTGSGEFNKPRSVAVDKSDNLYVVDMTGRVQKFSPDGKYLLSWQMPQTDLGKPKGLCSDQAGNIVVVEPHYQRLNHFSPEGKLVEQWGTPGTNAGQLTLPRSVAVNSKGDIFVTEYTRVDRVQSFSADGKKPLRLFGQPGIGDGEFNRAEGLGIDRSDQVYIADSCNHRIQVFSPEGTWRRSYGRAGNKLGELSYPYDVRVDAAGFQYVCEFGNSRVQVFDAHDKPVEILGGAGAAPGRFSNPWSIALDSRGNLYVADGGNNRVQKFLKNQSAARATTSAVTVP